MSHRAQFRPPSFSVEDFALPGGAPGVLVTGEVDISTAQELTTAIDAAIARTEGAFVVDLCDVTFLDSSAISVLVRARGMLGRDERDLVVVCPPSPVRRALDIVGVRDLLVFFDSREEASSALKPAS